MQIGWIDFSKEDRDKVLDVIHLLDEPGAVDELGLGIIRDAFADYFFPGTSTVQTRAKYFLIVPYVLYEAGIGMYGSDLNTILRRIDSEERSCRDILIKTSSDGIIGSLVPHSWVLRTPSNIYWNGIKRLGIFQADLSVKEYIQQSLLQKALRKAKAYGNRDIKAEENEKDDIDAGDLTTFQFWSLGDNYKKDWKKNLTIELLPSEASFLKTKIITCQRDTLFAYVLKHNVILSKYDSFGALSADLGDSVESELGYMMKLANDFNELVALITTRFNMIVSNGKNKRAIERWSIFSRDLEKRSSVDLKAIYSKLKIRNTSLKNFLLGIQEEFKNGNIEMVDDMIVRREVHIKGESRAKTKRAGEFPEQNWIGAFMFDYRFTPAKRIIRDILNAEVVSCV